MEEQRAHTIKALMGKVAKLMKHKTAATVVELAYNDYADAATRNSMLQEFLGPEFRLFKEPTVRTVGELIAKHPEKKEEIIKNMGANVEVLIQQGRRHGRYVLLVAWHSQRPKGDHQKLQDVH